MLRLDHCWLGRWGPRDFLRGRTKRGGAIHTRHTHGSQGRYKRLSSLFGLRDGRRHVGNHMKGGLGIKLGGGLFGLRIPRQHVLSTMSREEYEIAVYGHPNITNPYRQHMEEHPDLRGVMQNANLSVHVVVLMPRVLRVAAAGAGMLPPPWEQLLHHLDKTIRAECGALHEDGGEITLHCATTSASVMCDCLTSESMHLAAVSLFEDLMRGAKLGPLSTASLHRRYETKRIPLLGTSLLTPSATASPIKSTVLALPHTSPLLSKRLAKLYDSSHGAESAAKGNDTRASVSVAAVKTTAVVQRGVQKLLQDLRQLCPDALNLCLRLEGVLPTNDGTPQDHEAGTTPTNTSRKLLRNDMDPDEVGVWNQPAATADALMRWQYFNWDPRAHSTDGLPHHRRRQRVHIFVDASKVHGKTTFSATEASSSGHRLVTRSLMSLRFSESLQEMNFKRVSHKSLAETLVALRGWSADSQWRTVEDQLKKLSGEM